MRKTKMINKLLKRLVSVAVGAAVLTQSGCGESGGASKNAKQDSSFFAMDTYITVTAYGSSAKKGCDSAKSKITSLEKLWSVTDEESEIYAANHSTAKPVTLSQDTAELVSFALEMCKDTDGALDITLYPVLTAWGFTTDNYRVPDDSEIHQLLKNTGYEKITLEGNSLTVPNGMMLDIGAVGKGFAGDLAAKELKTAGVTSALIDLGGNIQTVGAKPDGSNWKIGIRSPFDSGSFATLSVKDKAVVTSGGYERYFEKDGEKYWHILDPKTGKPAHSGLASVTVVGDEGKLCDALSTSIFVMGLEKAEKLWQSRGDFDFAAVTDSGEIYITKGLKDNFKLSQNYADLKLTVIE